MPEQRFSFPISARPLFQQICDAALRHGGMRAYELVKKLEASGKVDQAPEPSDKSEAE